MNIVVQEKSKEENIYITVENVSRKRAKQLICGGMVPQNFEFTEEISREKTL